jgi:transmembrane sensor
MKNAGVKMEKVPFFVQVNDKTEVKVLGTDFNIQSYPDDPLTSVTLLKGAVKVTNGDNASVLAPGQQATVDAVGTITRVNKVDIDHVMAWKNGYFKFDGADIKQVMREMSRWYNVDIVYEGSAITQHFRGNISRNVDAANVFRMLEATDEVHFKIQDRKIIVSP